MTLHAVIIKGNPKYITSQIAKKYYEEIKDYLISLGVDKVTFDNGAAFSTPDLKADLYIGHSRGCDRREWLPPAKQKVFLMFGVPDGIVHPKDKKHIEAYFDLPVKERKDFVPLDEHFEFIDEQKEAIEKLVKKIKDGKNISKKW